MRTHNRDMRLVFSNTANSFQLFKEDRKTSF